MPLPHLRWLTPGISLSTRTMYQAASWISNEGGCYMADVELDCTKLKTSAEAVRYIRSGQARQAMCHWEWRSIRTTALSRPGPRSNFAIVLIGSDGAASKNRLILRPPLRIRLSRRRYFQLWHAAYHWARIGSAYRILLPCPTQLLIRRSFRTVRSQQTIRRFRSIGTQQRCNVEIPNDERPHP